MKLKLKYLLVIALLMVVTGLRAQVQFGIQVNAKEIGSKDEVKVEYVVSGSDKVSNFHPPYFEKWRVISGPDYSIEHYNIDGKKSVTTRYTYLLAPLGRGKLRLPAATIVVNDKLMNSREAVVLVKDQQHVAGATPAPAVPQYQGGYSFEEKDEATYKDYVLKPGEDPLKKIRNSMFVKAIASKKKVYVGEPVLVSYKLYTSLRSNSRVVKQPSFSGCSVSEMTTSEVQADIETVNGKKYRTFLFRKVQLFPLQPGVVTIGQASVDNTIEFVTSSADLKKLYYDNEQGQVHNITLSTEPYNIEVIPLPAAARTAAVGDFQVFTKLKHDTIAANETNSLLVTISGRGNFKSVSEPEISWPEGIYHFDATETDEVDKLSFPVSGKRVYEIPFEASATGRIDIAPVRFSFFDPDKGKYQTVHSSPLQLTVTPAIKANLAGALKKDEEASDIQFLYYILPLVFLMGGIVIWKNRSRSQPVPVVSEPQDEPAEEIATGRNAGSLDDLLLVQDDSTFYHKAAEMAKDYLGRGVGNQQILQQVLRDCNAQLYTPIPSTSRKEVIDALQRAIG